MLLLDSQRRYLYAWTPCHKFFEIKPPFTAMGPAEIVHLIDIIKPVVKGAPKEPNDKRRQIFEEHVHVAMDNFFSGGGFEISWERRIETNHDLQT